MTSFSSLSCLSMHFYLIQAVYLALWVLFLFMSLIGRINHHFSFFQIWLSVRTHSILHSSETQLRCKLGESISDIFVYFFNFLSKYLYTCVWGLCSKVNSAVLFQLRQISIRLCSISKAGLFAELVVGLCLFICFQVYISLSEFIFDPFHQSLLSALGSFKNLTFVLGGLQLL